MQSEEARYPSGRFFLLLALMGGVVGLVLLVLHAPFWLFYVAPFAMAPLVVLQLRVLAKEEESKTERQRATERLRQTELAGFVARQAAYDLPAARLLISLIGWVALAVATALVPLSLIKGEGLVSWGGLVAAGALVLFGLFDFLFNFTPLELSSQMRGLGPDRRHQHATRSSGEGLETYKIETQDAEAQLDEALRRVDAFGRDRALAERAKRSDATRSGLRSKKKRDLRRFKSRRSQDLDARAQRRRRRRAKARVQPSGVGQWVVSGRQSRQLGKFDTQLQALKAAEQYLINCGGGELLTQGRDPRASELRIAIKRPDQPAFQELLEQVALAEIRDHQS
ncbi:MAG TPA: DUF2188 domain-containing protein [Solirubrobacterales bacterium]|nr:DUF2188 domain-containing protein [Solirubrobacterales bacterium]